MSGITWCWPCVLVFLHLAQPFNAPSLCSVLTLRSFLWLTALPYAWTMFCLSGAGESKLFYLLAVVSGPAVDTGEKLRQPLLPLPSRVAYAEDPPVTW